MSFTKILSFDVGIVNLAFCIIKKNNDNNTFEILDWNIINIDNDKKTCEFLNKKNAICGKNAKFQCVKSYYCATHAKKHNITLLEEKCDESILCNSKKETQKKPCGKSGCIKIIDSAYFKDKIYCEKHLTQEKKIYLKENGPVKLKSQNSNYQNIQKLSSILYQKLDEKKETFLDVDYVLIENQPSLINPTMKTISSLIYGYFLLRGVIDKPNDKLNKKISEIRFISPQNKLKINSKTKEILDKDNFETKRQEYVMTKDLGKKYCKSLIQDTKFTEFLTTHKKQDDLCDSFLQGFYFLFYKDGILPEIYKKKLDTALVEDKDNVKNKKAKTVKASKKNKNIEESKGLDITK